MSWIWTQLKREFILSCRQIQVYVNASLLFMMILTFFPLAMPSNQALLHSIAPGLAWIATLLAMLLSADRLFLQDDEDGMIEQWYVSGYPVHLLITIKLWVNWCFNLLPIILLCPLIGVVFKLSSLVIGALILTLLCGSPTILCLCALAAAFSGGVKQKGVIMALILLPLTLPVMIFGSGAVTMAMEGMAISGYISLLLAISLLAFGTLPLAIASIIQVTYIE